MTYRQAARCHNAPAVAPRRVADAQSPCARQWSSILCYPALAVASSADVTSPAPARLAWVCTAKPHPATKCREVRESGATHARAASERGRHVGRHVGPIAGLRVGPWGWQPGPGCHAAHAVGGAVDEHSDPGLHDHPSTRDGARDRHCDARAQPEWSRCGRTGHSYPGSVPHPEHDAHDARDRSQRGRRRGRSIARPGD